MFSGYLLGCHRLVTYDILWISRFSFQRFLQCFVHCLFGLLWYRSMFYVPVINPLFFGFIIFFSFLYAMFRIFPFFFLLAPFFSQELQNILTHPILCWFPFESLYLFHCCFCDCYFEFYSSLVYFLNFS